MYKLLIVDDEPMIRGGLRTIIEWERYGFRYAGEAANGHEALERHRELAPDLILMDIRMPGLDGIRTIEEIRKTDKRCRILILSGYADFSYAKQAIAYGVDGYILKPIDEIELEEYARRIAGTMDLRERSGESGEWAVPRAEELLQDAIRDGGTAEEREERHKRVDKLLGESAEGFRLVLIEWSRGAEQPTSLFAAARRRLADIAKEEGCGWVFPAEPYTALLLKDRFAADPGLPQAAEWLRLAAGRNEKFIAVAGEPFASARSLAAGYPVLLRAMRRSFMLAGGRIHAAVAASPGAEGETAEEPDAASLEELGKRLHHLLDIGSAKGLPETLRDIGDRLGAASGSEQSIKTGFAQLLTLLLNRLAADYKELALQDELSVVTELYKQTNYDEMLERLERRLEELMVRLGHSDQVPVMKRITGYIERHYDRNLKLETIADIFGYNSGYLGKMFKSHTGEHFNTYLDQIRMRHAVELLQRGYKVHQVAELVGYANVDYFHAKFKKYKGVSPSYYKAGSAKSGR